MEFKTKKNVWLWFSQYFIGDWDYYPSSICPLFWSGILGIVTLILSPFYTLGAYLMSKTTNVSYKEIDTNFGFIKIILNIFIMGLYFVGVLAVDELMVPMLDFEWYHYAISLLVVPIFVALVIVLVIAFIYIKDKWEDLDTGIETPSVIGETYTAIKSNICPLINWEHND